MQQSTCISPWKLKNEDVLFLLRWRILLVPHGTSKSPIPCLGLFKRYLKIFPCALTRCANASNVMLTSKPHLQRTENGPPKSVRIPTTLLGYHLNLVSHCFHGLAHECTNTNTNTRSGMCMP